MIRLLLGTLKANWIAFVAMALLSACLVQYNLVLAKNQQITALQISTRMLSSQLQSYQAKAEVMNKLRRAMHHQTVTLRDTLSERRDQTSTTTEQIMSSDQIRDKEASLRWLRESIKDLRFEQFP